MNVFQEEIEFLGMVLKNGKYKPSPHIAAELECFPNSDLSKKKIQQFSGIVNYLCNFIPKLSCLTKPLQLMLKKELPVWSKKQTKAMVKLKQVTKDLPTLTIP